MTSQRLLFIQGGGAGAHVQDAPLAASLQQALGDACELHYPRMPHEEDPQPGPWQRQITAALSRLQGPVTLVGHSIGGAMLLRYLAQETPPVHLGGLVLLAAPAWDGGPWAFDDLLLPDDLDGRLAAIPRLLLYHCRDDEVVPFAHLALHAAKLPRAVTVAMEAGGHQFGNDLSAVAADLGAAAAA